jgi:hypothetical protein
VRAPGYTHIHRNLHSCLSVLCGVREGLAVGLVGQRRQHQDHVLW